MCGTSKRYISRLFSSAKISIVKILEAISSIIASASFIIHFAKESFKNIEEELYVFYNLTHLSSICPLPSTDPAVAAQRYVPAQSCHFT